MASIFNNVSYSSITLTSPFVVSLNFGFIDAPEGERGFFIIEQDSNKSLFANVLGRVVAGSLIVDIVEFTTGINNALPLFTGNVTIFSSIPVTQLSTQLGNGRDGVLVIGDGNAVGNNGAAFTSDGWNVILDSLGSGVLTYRKTSTNVNSTHDGFNAVDTELVNTFTEANEPLPHTQNDPGGNAFPDPNSIGFGLSMGKDIFYRNVGGRQVVLLPSGKTASSFDGGEWTATSGAMYTNAQTLGNEFLIENSNNRIIAIVVSLGLTDTNASAHAGFEAALDALITKFRLDAFTPNDFQTDFSRLPILVVGLPDDFVTANPVSGGAINSSLADTPNRFENCAFVAPTGLAVDASTSQYFTAPSMRVIGPLLNTAYLASFLNATI